jgi:ABC-2 type transport system permease protein
MPAEATPAGPVAAGRSPSTVVLWHTARRTVRSGVLWGYVFGLYTATQALAYSSTYRTVRERDRLASLFGSNTGVSALVGPAHDINTVAGYTVWKCLAVVAIVGAVWGLLAGTRLLRGEEDAGRWELLLAGQTTARGATAQAVGGLAAGFAALWLVTSVIVVAVGRLGKVSFAVGPSLFFSLAMVAGAAMFLAVGALTSQLAANRRQAAGYAAGFLGVSYAVRMVADSGTGLGWLRWASPLGWIEELQPLTHPQLLALAPIGAFVVVVGAVAVHLAGARDLGASTIPDLGQGGSRTRLLTGPLGLATRLVRPTVIAWGVGVVALGVLLGLIAKSGGEALKSSPTITKVLERMGAPGVGARTYLGIEFLIAAVLVSLIGAGQLSALRGEEATGRLDHLLVRPVSRTWWYAGRLGLTVAVLVVSGVLVGLFTWFGAASQHTGIGLSTLLQAGINVVPAAVCVVGIGALAFGVRPRATAFVTYAVIAWSFLVGLVGGIVNINHWVLDTSLYSQMTAAPALPVNWVSAGVLAAVGVGGALVGGFAFVRRDLAGE